MATPETAPETPALLPENPPETPAPAPAPLVQPADPAPETPAEPAKRKPGRPKGSTTKNKPKSKPARVRRSQASAEAADPFAAPARDEVEAAKVPEVLPPEGEPAAAPAPGKVPLGEEKATAIFEVLCLAYDGVAPHFVRRTLAQKIDKAFSTDAKKLAVFHECVEIVKLSEQDKKTLAPAVIARLAKIEVEPDSDLDLWFAIGAVLVGKAVMIRMTLSEVEKPAASAGA